MGYGTTVLPVRVHRITGKTEVLYPDGWRVAGESSYKAPKAAELKDVPVEELRKLQSTADVSSSELSCKVYNGSGWRIRELVLHVQVLGSNSPSPVLERDYRLARDYFTDPLTTGIFSECVWFELEAGQRIVWEIKSAKGEPE
jgi:hypothetical protein